MTIASLTAATAPTTASKTAATQTAAVAPDAQIAAVTTEAPVLSNLAMAVAAARQSAATQQDGLSVLMANLLRAIAAGNLPAPVQQAADQLLALHLPTDVAPDAAAVKTALLTSGLFTEANFAASPVGIPIDVKTALLLLNSAAEDWLIRAATASSAPSIAPLTTAATTAPPIPTRPAVRPEQAVPLAAPQTRDTRRTVPRANEPAKPATTTSPQRPSSGKSQLPVEQNVETPSADAAPDAENVKAAIRVLGQIAQTTKASGAPELPKEIKAVLALVNKAITSSLPNAATEEPKAATTPPAVSTMQRASLVPVAAKVFEPPATVNDKTAPMAIAKPAVTPTPTAQNTTQTPPQMPDARAEAPMTPLNTGPQRSSPVEQLLALQLAADEIATLTSALPASPPAAPASIGASQEPPSPAENARAPASQPDARAPTTPASEQTSTLPTKPDTTLPNTYVERASIPNEVKTLLVLFAKAAQTWLPRAAAAQQAAAQPTAAGSIAAQPTAAQPTAAQTVNTQPASIASPAANPRPTTAPSLSSAAPDIAEVVSALSNAGLLPEATITSATGGVPNDLKTLLLLFNKVAETWLPRAAGATSPVEAHTPSIPPPIAGAQSKAQPAALATLPQGADVIATAKQLVAGSDAALARQTLLQIASLPDATPQPRTPPEARWVFDIPLMTPQGAAVAQMIIERDGSGASVEKPTPVWRVQFAIDIEPLGPVRANLALSGEHTWVTITADRPETLAKLQSGVSWLADALQSNALEADIAFQPGLTPPQKNGAKPIVDRAS